jgi:hypothetical protein
MTGLAGLLQAEGNNEAAIEQEGPRTCNKYLGKRVLLLWKTNMYITYSACVFVVLIIQHAKRMRRIILSSVACLVVDCVLNVMAQAQKLDFVFPRNGRVHFNRQGGSVQLTTGR